MRVTSKVGSSYSKIAIMAAVAIVCAVTLKGSAQETAEFAEARAVGGQILQALEQLASSEASSHAGIRAQAATLIQRRAAALASLAEHNPAAALRAAFSPELTARLARAFPASAGQLEAHGTWEGPIEYVVEDSMDFGTHRNIRKIAAAGEFLSVQFADAEPPGLKNGDVLRVNGVRIGNILAASDAAITAAAESTPQACTTIGPQKSIVLLVTMPGVPAPANITVPDIWDTFFSPAQRSLSEYWREASFGKTWAEGDVKGWYTLDRVYSCEETNEIRAAAIAAADGDVDFTQYSRVFIIVTGMTGSCTWGGLGTLACGSLTSADGTFTASTSWMRAGFFNPDDLLRDGVQIAAHEGGHNIGLRHSNSRDFGDEPLGPQGDDGVVTEYGDLFSAMGRLRNNTYPEPWIGFGHYTAPQKLQLGWLTAQQIPSVTSGGSFSLQPTELTAPGSVQALQIVRGTKKVRGVMTTNSIWVEYRQPIGNYDGTLYPQVFGGALIHYQDDTNAGASHLLDFTPNALVPESTNPEVADWSNPALTGNWIDPYTGISITSSNPTSSALTVDVSFGPIPCVRANPQLTLSPPNPSAVAGANVAYTVSITNKDSSVCSNRTFNLSSTLPAGWATTFSATSVTLAPSATGSVTMTKTVPAGTANGLFDVNASATSSDGTSTGSGLASCTVAPGPAPLVVTLDSLGTYPKNSTVPIVATVSRTDSTVVPGASVLFTVTSPTGSPTTRTVIADAAGRASWNYRVAPKDPSGVYTVTARATFNSEVVNATPGTFTVAP